MWIARLLSARMSANFSIIFSTSGCLLPGAAVSAFGRRVSPDQPRNSNTNEVQVAFQIGSPWPPTPPFLFFLPHCESFSLLLGTPVPGSVGLASEATVMFSASPSRGAKRLSHHKLSQVGMGGTGTGTDITTVHIWMSAPRRAGHSLTLDSENLRSPHLTNIVGHFIPS